MRAIGLLLLLLGVLAFVIPTLGGAIPQPPISTFDLHVVGGCLIVLGGIVAVLTRSSGDG